MNYQGNFTLGDTLDIKFTTVSTTGVPTTLAGTPVVSAYVGNGTTEITAGVTLTVDFDGRTGLHNVRVVASSGNGFAVSTNVNLVITAGTVGGNSVVGYVVGSFAIQNRVVGATQASVDAIAAGLPLDATELNAIADAILKRDFSAVSGESARSLLNAARFLRNKWSVTGTALTVTKEDDTTAAWTSTLVTSAGADPIISSDPA